MTEIRTMKKALIAVGLSEKYLKNITARNCRGRRENNTASVTKSGKTTCATAILSFSEPTGGKFLMSAFISVSMNLSMPRIHPV